MLFVSFKINKSNKNSYNTKCWDKQVELNTSILFGVTAYLTYTTQLELGTMLVLDKTGSYTFRASE